MEIGRIQGPGFRRANYICSSETGRRVRGPARQGGGPAAIEFRPTQTAKSNAQWQPDRTSNSIDVMLSLEAESLTMSLATQVRNKAVEAYQEVFRMQM